MVLRMVVVYAFRVFRENVYALPTSEYLKRKIAKMLKAKKFHYVISWILTSFIVAITLKLCEITFLIILIDLIYADPPFFSNKAYEVLWGDGYELRAFEDRWKGGINNYVAWMEPKLKECHRVLKETGSMYLAL